MRAPAVVLSGGIELTTPAPLVTAGTLSDCLNYEVGANAGYSRVDGIEPFDGRPGVAEYRLLRLTAPTIVGAFTIRERVRFVVGAPPQPHEGVDGYIVNIAQANGVYLLTVVFAGGMADPALPDTLASQGTTTTAAITEFVSLSQPSGTQSDFDFALAALSTARRAQITPVPGRQGSDVLGGFLFKNKSYAIRDLPRYYFEGGYYSDADEGLFVTIDGAEHEILEVRVLGDEAGFIAVNPVAGSGNDVVGYGNPVIASLPVSGALSGAFVGVPYSNGLSVSGGTAPYLWSLSTDPASAASTSEPGDLSEVVLQSEATPAALWRATTTGWALVPLGREMAFINGTDGLEITSRALNIDPGDVVDTGWVFPSGSTVNGLARPNLNADDGVTATIAESGADKYASIVCKGFSFSGIPAGSQIVGVEVRIERQSNVGNAAEDLTVNLVGVAGGTENKSAGVWPASLTSATYGGNGDLWGSEAITDDVVRSASFGVVVAVKRNNPLNAFVATADHVAIRVFYAPQSGRAIYLWDGVSDVPATLVNVQVLGGDAGAGSASGYITLNAAKNSAKPRLVKVGDQIRTAPSGGGSLIGLAASRDRPIFFPGQFEVDTNRSKYQFDAFNFYGQDRYLAVYGVSGAGPAMTFDGANAIKIRVPLSPGTDIPRHLAKHGSMLVLGFFSGAVAFSCPGKPTEMRAAFGASSLETGDRLTALAPGGGDALLVVCESSTFVVRGFSQRVFTQQTVSARRGAIEYTFADPGRAIISDSFGLFVADTPESFEPATRQYMSAQVQPWLRERLQATISNEQRFLRPVLAVAVRSKNQYRLFFKDGTFLSMTMTERGTEITKGRYFDSAAPDDGWAVRNVWTGLDASGRERVFCSFNGTKPGLVHEVDVGRSFAGTPIHAYIVTNPIYAGSISQLKQFDRFFVAGSGGYASLDISFGINGSDPAGDSQQADFGSPALPAAQPSNSRRNPRKLSVDKPVEAFDVQIKFESLTATEAPHTLQYIEPFANVRGDSRGYRGDT